MGKVVELRPDQPEVTTTPSNDEIYASIMEIDAALTALTT